MGRTKRTPTAQRDTRQGFQHPPAGRRDSPWGFRGKTVWDWLQLLIVPIVLSLITIVFTWQQDARQQRIEDQRAQAERQLEEQRAQDTALQAFLDQMTVLLLEKELRNSEKGSEVQTLAQARTLTVLERLDPSRKTEVMRFLVAAQLVQSVDGNESVILLYRADLHGADLRYANLRGAELSSTDLHGADLSYADLSRAQLAEANLNNADLNTIGLSDANLDSANLSDADLSHAYLVNAYLSNTDLSNADLHGAELDGAPLYNTNLRGANLREADLRSTDLRTADLTAAKGINIEELEQQAFSLEGATMPNGQKYEDWLKSRGEDVENNGPSRNAS